MNNCNNCKYSNPRYLTGYFFCDHWRANFHRDDSCSHYLAKTEKDWTEEQEVQYVLDHYKTDSVTDIAEYLGRSVPFVLITISRLYTEDDDER